MTIAATIQAAEIQAAATYKAAIFGALGIIGGLLITWLTALHIQKVNRIAETRREVYLEFSESYAALIDELGLIYTNLDDNWASFLESSKLLSNKSGKVLFICETKNKRHIYAYMALLSINLGSFIEMINPIRTLMLAQKRMANEFNVSVEQLDAVANKIDRLGLDKNEPQDTEILLEHYRQLNKRVNSYQVSLKENADEIAKEMNDKRPFITNLINKLNEESLPLFHCLRAELGAKTDIELDKKIYNEYKFKS